LKSIIRTKRKKSSLLSLPLADGGQEILKRIFIKEEVCMGCGLCEVYCIVQHSKSKNIIKAFKRESPRPISRIRLEEDRPISFSIQCRYCEDAPCIAACLSGAMYLDEKTGLVLHDKDKCVGCWTCIMVCPYGVIRMDSLGSKIVKCDLCPELDVPACVANCPNEALVYQEVMDK
jgi:carbon-monoxide dehydrogenase iron sulfur subunit